MPWVDCLRVRLIDEDGTGEIDFDEFVQVASQKSLTPFKFFPLGSEAAGV